VIRDRCVKIISKAIGIFHPYELHDPLPVPTVISQDTDEDWELWKSTMSPHEDFQPTNKLELTLEPIVKKRSWR
jgi:hypothetical protein